jgi:intracellular sulfur oxidation DsrE/DsrF family protein
MTRRRTFLAQLGASAAALAFDSDELLASPKGEHESAWDTSWIDRVNAAKYRVVFNANEMNDGEVFGYVSTFFDNYHEVHNTNDSELRPVVVVRRTGTALGLNDAMWSKYDIGTDQKITDGSTNAPAKRNVYWKTASPTGDNSRKMSGLMQRGMIVLVCNVALSNFARRMAEKTQQKVEDVQNEMRANLVPGGILVPSGIYALIRAQNAGCAWMPGT